MAQTFFYDEQVRRFLLQFIRVFSNFQVEYGKDRAGNTTLLNIPVKYGDATRMVSSIIRENSENKVVPTPMISCYVTAMEYMPDRRQDPAFVDKRHIRMRKYDEDSGEYLTTQGNAYTVERMMPVPYQLTLNVDIWTSNTTQKLQLLEQLLVLFNPALEIQSTDNYLDWTSLSYIELIQTQWSSRAIPAGVDDQIDIATLTFTVPIWLTAPSKVKKLGVIQKIVASIYDESGSIADGIIDNDMILGDRMKFTPMNFGILLVGSQVSILHREETTTNKVDYDPLNDPPTKIPAAAEETTWKALINQYGDLQAGISQLRLEVGTGEIIGTVAHHPSDDYKLLFTINEDTKPTNTMTAVLKIINPLNNAPGAGLSASSAGQRYLILNAIGDSGNTDGADAWKSTANVDFVAGANDIIEYDGSQWEVKFDSSSESGVQYITNTTSGIQYKWNGTSWVKSYEGEYRAGDWSLVI